MKLKIVENTIHIESYRYRPSELYPNAVLSRDALDCVVDGYQWPALRTVRGEVLIFDYSIEDQKSLEDFAANNSLPLVKFVDIWSLLLEPFLDTEFTREDENRIQKILDGCGFSAAEVAGLRSEVSKLMTDYNLVSGLWEWANLGMNDLLNACIGTLNPRTRMSRKDFQAYYWKIMEIQSRGRTGA